MTTLTLHKLPEGFIVTSDEEYKDKDFVLLPITFDLRRCVNGTTFIEGTKKVIAQQDQIDFSALTEEEQKEIGWFDVEKLADNIFIGASYQDKYVKMGYIAGFKKAQELLYDTELFDTEIQVVGDDKTMPIRDFLIKPKSWTIEVEMEYQDMMGMWVSKPTILEHLDRPSRPKFTNKKLKVTKIL